MTTVIESLQKIYADASQEIGDPNLVMAVYGIDGLRLFYQSDRYSKEDKGSEGDSISAHFGELQKATKEHCGAFGANDVIESIDICTVDGKTKYCLRKCIDSNSFVALIGGDSNLGTYILTIDKVAKKISDVL